MGLNHEDTKTQSKYKAYPSYKDSGVEWLGKIPESWSLKKNGYLFFASKGGNAAELTKEFCASIAGIYPVYSGQTENKGVMAHINKFEFDTGQNGCLFSTTVGAKAMSVMHLKDKFSLSQNCMIFQTMNKSLLIRFFYYLFQPLFRFERGLIPEHMQASFRMEDFYQYKVPLPSSKEQTAIANFLDQETGKMDLLIEKQQAMIALLKEKRQAVISHAVTKGLNPNTPLKDSGIKWLGQIPEHWKLKELKYLARVNNGKDQKEVLDDLGEFPVYGSGGIFGYANQFLFDGISVLLGRKGTIDKPLLVNGKFWTVDTMYWTKLKSNTCPQWFYYCCLTIPFKFYQYGSALPSMTQEALHNHKFAVPKLQEQKEIASYLDNQTQKIDTLIEKSQQAIALLKERKTALISAAVTGKIDVRGVA